MKWLQTLNRVSLFSVAPEVSVVGVLDSQSELVTLVGQ